MANERWKPTGGIAPLSEVAAGKELRTITPVPKTPPQSDVIDSDPPAVASLRIGQDPRFVGLSPAQAYALNEELSVTQVLDDAYWAESLAGKNPEPFVM